MWLWLCFVIKMYISDVYRFVAYETFSFRLKKKEKQMFYDDDFRRKSHRKSELNSTKIYDEVLFLRARRTRITEKEILATCLGVLVACGLWTHNRRTIKKETFRRVFVSVNVWRVTFSTTTTKKIFPECNFVVRTQFKYCQETEALIEWNRTI